MAFAVAASLLDARSRPGPAKRPLLANAALSAVLGTQGPMRLAGAGPVAMAAAQT